MASSSYIFPKYLPKGNRMNLILERKENRRKIITVLDLKISFIALSTNLLMSSTIFFEQSLIFSLFRGNISFTLLSSSHLCPFE